MAKTLGLTREIQVALDIVSFESNIHVQEGSQQQTIIATAIPHITDQFHSIDQVGWYGSAFFLCLACLQSTWGKAYKYFSPKKCFLLSIFIFELGSLLCG